MKEQYEPIKLPEFDMAIFENISIKELCQLSEEEQVAITNR